MILANPQPQASQQVLIASQSEGQQGQTIKFIQANTSNYNVNSPTKTITFAQAQQMGLLPTNKVQHILPSTAQKQTTVYILCFIKTKANEFFIKNVHCRDLLSTN